MEFVTGLRYVHGGWSEEIFQGEEICGVVRGICEERIQRGEERSEEGSTYQGAGSWTQCQHAERRIDELFIPSPPVYFRYFRVFYDINVKTVGISGAWPR